MKSALNRFIAATLALLLCAGLAGCSDASSTGVVGGADASEVTVVEAE